MKKYTTIPEYIYSTSPSTGILSAPILSNTTNVVAHMINPHWSQSVNRVAFFAAAADALNGFTGTAVAGIASVLSNGLVGDFIGSGTTSITIPDAISLVTNSNPLKYYEFEFSDVNLTAGTPYYVAIKLQNIGTGGVQFNVSWFNSWTRWPQCITGTNTFNLGMGNSLYGYNNGSITQWYGYPGAGSQSVQLHASANSSTLGSTWVEVGGMINLPYIAGEYKIRSLGVGARLANTAHTVRCQIFKGTGTTQVENASATVSGVEAFSNISVQRCIFEFPGTVSLYPGESYRIAFTATGATGANTAIVTHKPFATNTSYTDTSQMSRYDNSQDVYNKFYTRLTSTSDIDTSYGYWSGWLTVDFYLESLYSSSRRGATGPINYQVPGEGLKLWLEAGQYQSYPQTGTAWYDLSGNGYHFSGTTSVTWSSDSGGAFSHPDENDRAWKNSSVPASIWSSDFTILSWAYLSARNTADYYLFSSGTSSSSSFAAILKYNAVELLNLPVIYLDVNNSKRTILADTNIANNQWSFYALRYKSNTTWANISCLTPTSTSNVGTTISISTNGTSLNIGGASWDSSNTKYHGLIGSFIVYDKFLTNDEIKSIYSYTREKYGINTIA